MAKRQRRNLGAIFYVYVLLDELAVPRWIGKGLGDRMEEHEKSSSSNWMKDQFIEHTFILLGEIPKLKIRENLTEAEAFATEMAFIKAIGRFPDGPLTNLTDGGEGASGHVPSEWTRIKKREKLLGWPRPQHVIDAVKIAANNRSKEWYRKQRESHLGQKPSETARAKMSAAGKGRKRTPESIAKTSAAHRGVKLSQQAIENMKAAFTQERRAALAELNKGNKYGVGNKKTPEGQARCNAAVAEANRRRVVTDEYREKRRAIAKAMWAARRAREEACRSQTSIQDSISQ